MVILIIGVNKMYKKLKKIFLVMSILGVLFTNTYAEEVKEVQLIDDFSAELLGEPKDQEPAVQKSPVKQDTQEVTENKDENKQNEKIVNKETEKPVEKKDKKDLTSIEDTICKYFVICQGNSPSQVNAIVDSVKEFARKGADSKPTAIDGLRNAEWVAMDYSDVLVHVFLPEVRSFYNLEHLWADAKLTQIPDLD